jgi:phage tail protein X
VTYYRTKEGDTADLIAWRIYGRQDAGVVEAILEANPGLADRGPELPEGMRLLIPDAPQRSATASVRLWS